ncbi:hypothetical protein [Streptomyces misionensis]
MPSAGRRSRRAGNGPWLCRTKTLHAFVTVGSARQPLRDVCRDV